MRLATRVLVQELKQCCEEPMWVDAPRDPGPPEPADEPPAESADRGRSDQAPQGSISAERLREVLRRIKTGFYDRPEVREEIARRLRRDLDEGPGKP